MGIDDRAPGRGVGEGGGVGVGDGGEDTPEPSWRHSETLERYAVEVAARNHVLVPLFMTSVRVHGGIATAVTAGAGDRGPSWWPMSEGAIVCSWRKFLVSWGCSEEAHGLSYEITGAATDTSLQPRPMNGEAITGSVSRTYPSIRARVFLHSGYSPRYAGQCAG